MEGRLPSDLVHREIRPTLIRMPGRSVIRFTLLLSLTGLFLLSACSKRIAEGSVQLEHGAFVSDGRPFFPLVVNYIADLQWNDTACWAASCRNYERSGAFRFRTRDSSLLQIKGEFELIRQMGFNTVRIVGITSDLVFPPGGQELQLQGRFGMGQDSLYSLQGRNTARYLDAVSELVGVAEACGLKVILLVRMLPGRPEYEERLVLLVDRLRDKPTLMAYDLFNEPLYFDQPHHRPKKEVQAVVQRWRQLIRRHAPHQLVTIGLVGVPEVFAWDPNILDVDFISFHPYEYEPEQVRNEIRWYGEHVGKPWIIGETAIPADNDSVPYADQLEFARKTLKQTRACGGAGYSWWQFKDVHWGRFHADFLGVVDRHGWTDVDPALPPVEGTVKPVVQAFQEFDPKAEPGACVHLPNYHNFSSLKDTKLTGKLMDGDRQPIGGGVVLAWNANWTRSYYTISKADGTFELFGDFRFHHWMASATRYSMVRGDCMPNAFLTGPDSIAGYYLGDLVLDRLSDTAPRQP